MVIIEANYTLLRSTVKQRKNRVERRSTCKSAARMERNGMRIGCICLVICFTRFAFNDNSNNTYPNSGELRELSSKSNLWPPM